jgi:integrase
MALPKVRNERHAYIGRTDMLRIARAMTNRSARAMALVAFYSGMRLGEVLRAVPTDRGWLIDDTKNGDRRLVPIHPRVAHFVHNWPPACSPRTAHKRFTAAAQLLGFDDLHFHDLRHSAASEMINAGVDLYTVGAVLGHRAAASTKRYSHLTTDTLAKALRSIGSKP